MGIHGLLSALKDIQVEKHIRDYSQKTVGVDGLCWYHYFHFIYILGCIREHTNLEKS